MAARRRQNGADCVVWVVSDSGMAGVGSGAPTGTRTPVFAVRGRRPGPLDDGSGKQAWYYTRINLHTIAVIDNRTGQAHYLAAHHPARGTQYFAQPDFR